MKFILGKKLEMSQVFNEDGEVIPVTLVKAGPCKVVQIKTKETDGYSAVQVGFDKKKSLSKALKGHLKGLEDFRWLREFRINDQTSAVNGEELNLKRGDKITVDTFEVGDQVKVTGVSKGKGFQGVIKRHGFHGSPASHGHKDQLRMPGSIGATEPARVFKGMRMPGHLGNRQTTVKNLEIVKIDADKNILYIKGAVPGARGSLLMISGRGKLKIAEDTENKKAPQTQEEKKKPSPEIPPDKKQEK